MKTITSKQRVILKSIYQAMKQNGYPPSVREIAAEVGLASTSTVHGHLSRLEENGYISRDASKNRAIELTELGLNELDIQPEAIPVLGRVAAGEPILAVENAMDYYPIPPSLSNYDAKDLFMLEIQGQSMINIGILDRDLVIVRRQSSANNGDIVIAMTEESEATCKTFFKRSDHYILRPENDNMEDIILNSVSILGKVVGLFREF